MRVLSFKLVLINFMPIDLSSNFNTKQETFYIFCIVRYNINTTVLFMHYMSGDSYLFLPPPAVAYNQITYMFAQRKKKLGKAKTD